MTSPSLTLNPGLPRPFQTRDGAIVIEEPGDFAAYMKLVGHPPRVSEAGATEIVQDIVLCATAEATGEPLPLVGPTPPGTTKTRLQVYMELAEGIRTCTACKLCETRTHAVPGIGLLKPGGIVIIGEAPGENEDLQGAPFVGASGRILADFLKAAGLTRQEVYIMNEVNCRPPDNRDPHPSEQVARDHWMVEQLQLLQPAVIITLGRHSGNAMTSPRTPGEPVTLLTRTAGALRKGSPWKCTIPGVESALVFALYHPSYLMRPQGRAFMSATRDTFVEACRYAHQ